MVKARAHEHQANEQQLATAHGIQPEHRGNRANQEEQAHDALAQNRFLALAHAERGHNIGAERVNGVHRHHLAQNEHAHEHHAFHVAGMQQHAQRGLRLLFLILELDVFAEHAVHDFVSLFLATLLRKPHGRFRNIVTANQQNNAGNNRRTEHPLPAIGHGIQEIAHERGHRSAQIPRRRHRAHRNAAVFLRRELGDKRSRNGIVGTYEHADEEARRDKLPRIAAKTLRIEKRAMATRSIMNIFWPADGIGQIAGQWCPPRMPSITDAPIAADSDAVRLNMGVICVSATPISEST